MTVLKYFTSKTQKYEDVVWISLQYFLHDLELHLQLHVLWDIAPPALHIKRRKPFKKVLLQVLHCVDLPLLSLLNKSVSTP